MQDLRKQPLDTRLSALLDGEIGLDERQELERLLSVSGEAQDIFERLKRGSDIGRKAMDEVLKEPVPLALVREIRNPQLREKPGPRVTLRGVLRGIRFAPSGPQAVAACLICLIAGGGLGYMLGAQQQPVTTAPSALAALPARNGWLDDIAAAHRVYSRQQRHLAEVPPADANHIVEWLSQSVGVDFTVPDLSADHFGFEGARLLVADGKPTGQLLYRNDDNDIIAICFTKGGDGSSDLNEIIRDDIGLVTWQTPAASFVVAGPSSEATLTKIAEAVSGHM